MSYILDALRKSESERQQGRVPDLGQQVRLIHRPKKKAVPVTVWVGVGLILNALILAVIFWPGIGFMSLGVTLSSDKSSSAPQAVKDDVFAPVPIVEEPASPINDEAQVAESAADKEPFDEAVAKPPSPELVNESEERPTMIVPSWSAPLADYPEGVSEDDGYSSRERVPHLVELPMSFQRRVPTLIFNSHIYASDPSARRVMINDQYLRPGEQFSGIRVDRITPEGVELSLEGQRFRVGVVRDWISPQ